MENVANAELVTVYAVGSAHVSKTTLNEDGSFVFDGLAADEYEFQIVGDESASYEPISMAVPVEDNAAGPVFERLNALGRSTLSLARTASAKAVDYNRYLFFEVRQVGRHLKYQAD